MVAEEPAPWWNVEAGSAGGALLRRAWQPVLRSCDLPPGGVRRVRVLGEDLVALRTADGRPGVLQRPCPHRGTFLELGRVTERGLECMHHGWCFGVDGREAGGRPGARALPVRERLGLLFAWLGPAPAPPLPSWPAWSEAPGVQVLPPERWPVGFFDRIENSLDVQHVRVAHRRSGLARFVPEGTRCRVRERPWGLSVDLVVPEGHQAPPSVHFVLPNLLVMFAPVAGEPGWVPHLVWRVPEDGTRCVSYAVVRRSAPAPPDAPADPDAPSRAVQEARRVLAGQVTLDALSGHPNLTEIEDCVALMGRPAPDRRTERLVDDDVPVVRLRRLWREALEGQGPLDQSGPEPAELGVA